MRIHRVPCAAALLILACLSATACAPGYNSVLFATKSNIGVDIDTTQSTAEFSIARTEGLLAPTFEGGQIPPVLASINSETDSAATRFFWGVNTFFSTGDAAHTAACLFNNATTDGCDPTGISLTAVPIIDSKHIEFLKPGMVKPTMFISDTSFGLKIRGAMGTTPPDFALKLGFNRRELAIAPVGLTNATTSASSGGPDSSERYTVKVPSLMAMLTLDSETSNGTKINYLQYFSAGAAATDLAKKYQIRKSFFTDANPEFASAFETASQSDSTMWVLAYIHKGKTKEQSDAVEKDIEKWITANSAITYSVNFFIYDPEKESDRLKYKGSKTTVLKVEDIVK